MKAPKFWSQPGSPLGKLLSPLGCAYRVAGSIKRSSVRPAHVNARVICVGNLVAGGTGKTPVSLAIAACLQREDLAFLTRGYGGRLAGPVRVARDTHTPAEVGDEAFLLARAAPVWVARDRVAGAEAAINAGSRLIVMDDGFQNPSLAKNVGIIVIDGETGFGNGQLIPAGPRSSTVISLAQSRSQPGWHVPMRSSSSDTTTPTSQTNYRRRCRFSPAGFSRQRAGIPGPGDVSSPLPGSAGLESSSTRSPRLDAKSSPPTASPTTIRSRTGRSRRYVPGRTPSTRFP